MDSPDQYARRADKFATGLFYKGGSRISQQDSFGLATRAIVQGLLAIAAAIEGKEKSDE